MPFRSLALAAVLVSMAAPSALAQWSGRRDELVIYAVSKSANELQILAPGGTGSSGTVQIVDTARLPEVPLGPDFPAKRLRVLHAEPDDFFAYATNVERVRSPRQLNRAPAKALFLDGLLRDENPGSVSLKALDVTGGLYVPLIPGTAVGPDEAVDEAHYLIWAPNPSAPFVAVPEGTPSQVGPAGLTGVELEAVSGAAAFFVPWENLRRRYPGVGWPEGIDLKVLDRDPRLGNTSLLIRVRPGKQMPLFSFTGNTHLFVLEGNGELRQGGGAYAPLRFHAYAFVPRGVAIGIGNPKTYSGPTVASSSESER